MRSRINPFVADEKVLAGGKSSNTLGETLHEVVSRFRSRCLAHDCLDDGKKILGAMRNFPQRIRHLLFSLFPGRDVESDAHHAARPAVVEIDPAL